MTTYNEDVQNIKETTEVKYNLTIDPRPRSSKPSEVEKKSITRNLTVLTGLTINDFSTYVSQPFGYTWSGGIFDGTRSNKSWLRQWIFALDFDKGTITIEQVYTRLKEFGIVPQLWYTSFSDSPALRKFRVVLFLDQPITEQKLHQFLIESLLKLFPEADPSCKDASRYFFGGGKSVVTNTDPISTNQFIDALSIHVISSDSNSLRKLPLSSDYYTGLKSAEKRDFLYSIYRDYRISAERTHTTPTTLRGGVLERIDWSIARQNVRILNEFLSGGWLYHMELFGLATNLIYISGGRKLMTETMNKFNQEGETNYTQNNFNILTYVNKVKYPPTPLSKFSPFEEDHQHYDIISATKETRGKFEIIEPIVKIELSIAEQQLKDSLQEIMTMGKPGKINLLNPPPAIGKTELILSEQNVTISVPTNNLKNEIAGRMMVKYTTTPDPVVFENETINRKLQYYYNIGLQPKATAVLHDIINPKNFKVYSSNDRLMAEQYLDKVISSLNSNDTVLTTHSRSIHTIFKHDTVIYDEDPLNHLIDIKQIFLSDLFKLNIQSGSLFENDLDPIINLLKNSIPGEIKQTPFFDIDTDQMIGKVSQLKIESNIFEFFASNYFMRDSRNPDCFHYVIKRDLPKDKKVIIMSATLPIYIYEKLFGDRLNVTDFRDVKQQGYITQYTRKSYSRHSLMGSYDKISEEVGDKPVITFKAFGNQFKNPVENMYFGNCSGYDTLKGQDIAVVGTPHRNNIEYYLTAKVLGIDFKTTDTTMIYQKIEYNGFRFMFNCFINEDLRRIQLSLIESDLIQAVGRARTLRTDAKVVVYSNFPLRIADEFRY